MTTKQYDDSNRGALFKNDTKEQGDTRPNYKGSINVAGHDYWLSAWLKESKDGKKYMSLSVQQKDGKPAPVAAGTRDMVPTPAPRRRDDMDDEIPF